MANISHHRGHLAGMHWKLELYGQSGDCRTRLEGQAQPVDAGNTWPYPTVSILTQPEGQVQLLAEIHSAMDIEFQSSPSPKARCNTGLSSGRLADAVVSILTQPEGQVQRDRPYIADASPNCFNPHPARRPGATRLGRKAMRRRG